MRVYDTQRHRRLVAAVEIISPANKDRPEHRRAFVAKCAALLQQQVSVALVDLVTTRRFNLYVDLLELLGQADPSLAPEPPVVYAAACRWAREGDAWHFRAWTHTLVVGQPLPLLAVVAGRQPGRAPGAGSDLRGDLPHPPHPVTRPTEPNRARGRGRRDLQCVIGSGRQLQACRYGHTRHAGWPLFRKQRCSTM